MKQFVLPLLLFPLFAYPQYRADCFSLDLEENALQIKTEDTFDRDTILPLNIRSVVMGLSVSGTCVLNNDDDSYVRVILVDEYNHEFLVYENYPLLSDGLITEFTNTALETVSLGGITPQYLKIDLQKANVRLVSVNYTIASSEREEGIKKPVTIQKEQAQYIVDKLNANLKRKNMTWRAGLTSMSEKSYSEKKDMFGGKVPVLYGVEYYAGGIFVVPGSLNSSTGMEANRSTTLVSEWDWRDRHGKNWMTSVKDQGNHGTCWTFSSVGLLESYVNLYYNRLLNYNLSEQELISCSNYGGNSFSAFNYIRQNGIVPEDCFRYNGSNVSCTEKCDDPTEKVYIQTRKRILYDESVIKQKLFVAPIAFAIVEWNHEVVLAGYKTIHNGDVIYNGNDTIGPPITINDSLHQDLIGKTAWLVKNSWGTGWGTSGYGYVVATPLEHSCYISGKITSQILTDEDVVCEDKDGDGYYFWGVGEKPAYCPSWVPDFPDGDDSNANNGSLDSLGFLERLNPDTIPILVINSSVEYNTRQSIYSHIKIEQNGELNVKDTLNLFGHVTITIENGGKLIIDGGVITNAHIVMNTGSQMKFLNNGLLVCRTDDNYFAPNGAIVDMEYGKICNSHDF